jgi:hypothetical protein
MRNVVDSLIQAGIITTVKCSIFSIFDIRSFVVRFPRKDEIPQNPRPVVFVGGLRTINKKKKTNKETNNHCISCLI